MSESHATNLGTLTTGLDNTLGAMLVGALFSMTLWGVTCTQTYDYFKDNTDGPLQRSIVALLWMIDTLSSALHSHMVYYYLVTSYGDPRGLQNAIWSLNCNSLVAGISNFIIRSMFARRIYQFGRKNIITPTWIMVISICDLVVGVILSAKAFQTKIPGVTQSISKLLYLSFALGVTADLSVTVALCWLLQSAKSGFRKSDLTVNALMAYVVNTGLLVTVIATVGMVTYVAMPDNLIFLAFFFIIGKLYVNAYLATLNARGRLREKLDSGVPLSRLDASSSQRRETLTKPFRNSTLAVSFQKTVETKIDVSDDVDSTHVV